MRDEHLNAACHCGTVRFRFRPTDGLNTARRCTCSLCRMRGAIAISAEMESFEILQGQDRLTLYQFNTRVAKHYFCSVCGIYSHHQRRSDPTVYGVNLACIEGMSPFDLKEVIVVDGVSHTSDTGKPSRRAGILRFEPEE